MATGITEDIFKQIAKDTGSAGAALTTLSDNITKCLADLTAVASTTVTGTGPLVASTKPIVSVTEPKGVGASGPGASIVSGATNPLGPPSATLTTKEIIVNLLLKLQRKKSMSTIECRMVNDKVNSLPEARKNEFWFNHTLTFTKSDLGKITLDPSITQEIIAKDKATFLTAASASPTQNEADITITKEFIDNIIEALATGTGATYKTPPVYLQFNAAIDTTTSMANPWSQVDKKPTTDSDKAKTIEITPDVQIGITSNIISYTLSFADETRFIIGATGLTFMDGTPKFTPDADTITLFNAALKPIKITLLGGGKKKRQSRKSRKYTKKLSKGGKRSRKSRRF